ncbi:MAG: bifunctional 4-hydroxy-2-oxoglutarate aldolase/2-dehydro-3-deoxy-phosphogluconate aldolase [Lentisphaerae bacterium]|nr:bifunctional 4-hydroxy-2-oxoglutarate aldolase/2-dehydro-3-deoxy-phosphogluconate aldolase [Lentisphaerota bacterium]
MDRIARTRIVPAATVENTDQALKLAGALMDGGLDIVEFTFRTEAAGKAIAAVAREFPDMLVGAGTVLNEDQVRRSVDAGAGFAVAPGLNPKVAELARRMGLSFIPGVATPTEIEAAMALGIKLLKFFPAENLGGMKMLSALSGPYGHTGIKFLPTGGIGASNARDYLALPIVAAVGGSWMVAKELVKAGDWAKITALSRDAVAMVAALR